MSLDRQDVRAKLCHLKHSQLKAIAEVDNRDIGEIIEEVMCAWIDRRVHDATVLAQKIDRLGKPGNSRD